MSNDPLILGLVDPYKLATQHRTMQGECSVVGMERVGKLLASSTGSLNCEVKFTFDEEKLCVVSGDLHGELVVCCQRCLQPFAYEVTCNFTVSPVNDDKAAKALPEQYDPVMLLDNKINLLELIEDELILSLPQVPMHDLERADHRQQCRELENKVDAVQGLSNPFQILQKLKLSKSSPEVDDSGG